MQALFGLNASMAMLPRAMVASSRWAPSSAAIALCVFACFALVALVTLTPVARWNARWMALAGALTYPIYLIHENLGWFLISRLRGSLGVWGSIVCATVAALIAAALLYYLVEKPLGPLLRRTTLAMIRSNVHPQRSDSPITVRHERSGDPRFRMPVPRPDGPLRDLPGRAMGAAQLSARSAYEPTREMPSPVS
jgi:peptidoglycan/LPS O-acetylase OafA/YrhL